MTTATARHTVAVRLDYSDFEALQEEADALGKKPGSLAQQLLHEFLAERHQARTTAALSALKALDGVARRARGEQVDPVEMIRQGRDERSKQNDSAAG